MTAVNVKTLTGDKLQLDRTDLDALRANMRGKLLLPGDSGYDDARTIWNGMIDRRPAVVARCIGAADVMACVAFASERGIHLCIKGGGHNIAGLAVNDGAMMIDLSLMRGVWVDQKNRIAHAQAGCTLGDVDRDTQMHGLAAVLGLRCWDSCPTPGSRVSRWVAALAISRAAMDGPATTSDRFNSSLPIAGCGVSAIPKNPICSGVFVEGVETSVL
jgi:hypothetical protein